VLLTSILGHANYRKQNERHLVTHTQKFKYLTPQNTALFELTVALLVKKFQTSLRTWWL
jgi:hypothetical protein